jgi:hypothetical protein
MNEDQFQKNNKLFIICMISLVTALGLLAFSLYILPVLFWHAYYNVPEFVSTLHEWLKENYAFTESGANWTVFLIFFIPGIIASIITYIMTNIIENNENHFTEEMPTQNPVFQEESNESFSITMKVISLIVLVVVAVLFAEWFFSVTL